MTFVSLETVERRAPLGVRFKDITRDTDVTSGLLVQARLHNTIAPPQTAVRSPLSGIYGFHRLPGLRAYEWGERPASDWCADDGTPEEPNFVVTVEDSARRFLPQLLLLCLPKAELLEVPLYSAPARTPPGGYAVVRGELWHNAAGAPAAWAVVTASPGDYATIADERGLFALFLPVPPLSSAPAFGTTPLDELAWPLTFQVLYAPAAQEQVLAGHPPSSASIVGQAAATIFDTPTASGQDVTRSLPFGRELTLATAERARLLVDPL